METRVVTSISGWRAAVVIVLALIFVALLLTAIFWAAIVLATIAAVAWLNLLLLPRLALRVHLPLLVLAIALFIPFAGLGYLAAGVTGAVEGAAIWLLGVAVPRAVLWRVHRRQQLRANERVSIIVPHRP